MKTLSFIFMALGLASAHANHRSHGHRKYRTAKKPTPSATPAVPATPAYTGGPAPLGNSTGNSILIPLYSYPHNGAWDPLFQAYVHRSIGDVLLYANMFLNRAESHPNTTFIVIVNPDNGPTASPDAAFTEAIQKVHTFPNVEAIGYIPTGYGDRSASDIVKDVETYSGWAQKNAALDGVFFDEIVAIYSSSAASTYETINQAVKGASGLQGHRTVSTSPHI